jgi:hypothetical protein
MRARPASLNRSRDRFDVEEEESHAAKDHLAALAVRQLCARAVRPAKKKGLRPSFSVQGVLNEKGRARC